LQWEDIDVTTDNLNVTSNVSNVFIHTGSGEDAIDVSHANGNNVLDGSTGSNFLVGGTGEDTFFVDDRSPSAAIWSTVSNFHAGDAATIFGITQSGFDTSWVDGQGATGYTGLTLHVTGGGHPTASLTLAGFSTADLSNGRISTTWGTEADGTPWRTRADPWT
jgi:Ca2+-binding RTX toxin-like protein